MCGIVGVWDARRGSPQSPLATAEAMAASIRYRGPDDSGTWSDDAAGVGLGFRRLAIIDLSPNGHQPMASRSGRFTLVFNGEIYNYVEISQELRARGHTFRGHSDTEVALAAFEEWGIEASLPRFVGMFAMAVWDAERRNLVLIRDRFGIKPLFLWQRDGVFAFASELKPFFRIPGFAPEVDTTSLAQYFRHLYVPAPRSILRHVTKLLPGHALTLTGPSGDVGASRPYWSLDALVEAGRRSPFRGSDHEAIDLLDGTLREAVRIRMRSDVPVGAFLSGGIDSTTVVAMMQELSPRPVRTFTVRFDVEEHDEGTHAAAVASFLGTEHTTISLSGRDALDLIPDMPETFDEPLADPSQFPTHLICRAARESVTVAVSGDGGDELFGGYNRYTFGPRAIRRAGRIPAGARGWLARAVTSLSPGTWDGLYRTSGRVTGRSSHRLVGEKMHKLGHMLAASGPEAMYESLVSAWQIPPVSIDPGGDPRAHAALARRDLDLVDRMMLADQGAYLADDLLAKVDRASMAVSLEVRVPILDHRVAELSWRLPGDYKIRDGESKWILRRVLFRRVPRELVDRPKVGFSVPLSEWLRGPLREWAEDRLSAHGLARTPELDVRRIRTTWDDFTKGRSNQHLALWTVLVFESWRDRWLGPR